MARVAANGKLKKMVKTRRGSVTNIVFPQQVTPINGTPWTLHGWAEMWPTTMPYAVKMGPNMATGAYRPETLRDMAEFFHELADAIEGRKREWHVKDQVGRT